MAMKAQDVYAILQNRMEENVKRYIASKQKQHENTHNIPENNTPKISRTPEVPPLSGVPEL